MKKAQRAHKRAHVNVPGPISWEGQLLAEHFSNRNAVDGLMNLATQTVSVPREAVVTKICLNDNTF